MSESYGKVAVLMGGASTEREISLKGGAAVLESLLRSGVDAIGLDVGVDILDKLTQHNVQRVFIMLHGRDGEDGRLQSAMEKVGVAYTGSGIYSSELTMDKISCKHMWQEKKLSTPDFYVLNDESDWDAVIADLGTAFVKPVNEGSSIGIGKASTSVELYKAYEVAKKFDPLVIAERWVDGPEYTVGILGKDVLPTIELRTKNEFYDYEAKYESDETQYICPAELSEEKKIELEQLSIKAFEALECYGWGRVDVMQDGDGKFWLLEVNTVPGMTKNSLVPMAAKAAGIDFDSLVMEIMLSSDLLRRGIIR